MKSEQHDNNHNAAERYHELALNYLHVMSQELGELLNEQRICEFVVETAASLLGCERASIMLYDPESQMLRIRASVGLPEEIAASTLVKPGDSISGKVFESGQEVFVGANDPMPSESLRVGDLTQSRSFLSVPLRISRSEQGEPQVLGVMNLTLKIGGGMFTPDDLKLIHAVAAHTGAQIQNCRLAGAVFASERERRLLEQELQIAADIQLSLLPEKPLCAGPLEVAGVSRPAKNVGGDFFDYWQQDGRVCLLVADVSGHNLGAALMATAFRSVVRTESAHRESVSQLVGQVNRVIYPDLVRSELLITLCYLEVNLRSGLLTFCCCGHPHPLLLRGTERIWLSTGGSILGLEEETSFEEGALCLAPGDVLITYTDGLLEAGAPHRKQFGTKALLRAVEGAPKGTPLKLAEHIMRAVDKHVSPSETNDDVTILVAGFSGSPEAGGRPAA